MDYLDMSDIIIHKSKVTTNTNLTRVYNSITVMGQEFEVFCEVEEKYGNFLETTKIDALIFLLLPIALKLNLNIESKEPCSEQFKHNIVEYLIPSLVSADSSINRISINCPTIQESISEMGKYIGTCVTGGVDSTWTIRRYTESEYYGQNLTHLFVSSCSVDLKIEQCKNLFDWLDRYRTAISRYKSISKQVELPIVFMFSNYFDFLLNFNDNTGKPLLSHVLIDRYITFGNILSIKKMFRTFYISSSDPVKDFSILNNQSIEDSEYELLLCHVLTTRNFFVYSAGIPYTRLEKTISLQNCELAKNTLHPCFSKKRMNCSRPGCKKCTRALLTYDYIDCLDNFNRVFHIDYYKQNRIEFFYNLVSNKDNKYLNELYNLFLQKDPKIIKEAEDFVFSIDYKNFLLVKDQLSIANNLLSSPNLPQLISSYMSNYNLEKILLLGDSEILNSLYAMFKQKFVDQLFLIKNIENLSTNLLNQEWLYNGAFIILGCNSNIIKRKFLNKLKEMNVLIQHIFSLDSLPQKLQQNFELRK